MNRIKELRKIMGINQQSLSAVMGISRSTIAMWETGKSQPDNESLLKLAAYFNVTTDYLLGRDESAKNDHQEKSAPSISDEAQKIAKQYDNLDSHGKRVVKAVADEETARMQAEQAKPTETEKPATKIIPLFGNSFAAGPGEPDLGNMWDDYEVPIESHAEFAIRINGDSMEPYLHDGSIALGRKEMPRDGDVAAILLDGTFLCKQVCQDSFGNLYLFSLNRERADMDVTIRHDSERSVSCFGTIIMNKRIPLPII